MALVVCRPVLFFIVNSFEHWEITAEVKCAFQAGSKISTTACLSIRAKT